jgi:hypothetical protein
MSEKLRVTALHVERGRQMRSIVLNDIVHRGLAFDDAVEALAERLDVEFDVVKLAIAIANDADGGGPCLEVTP